MLEFDKHVPLSRCRLVRYDELNDAAEESLESHAGHTMERVMGGVRATYKLDLMLEWRAEGQQFEVYSAGDTTLQVSGDWEGGGRGTLSSRSTRPGTPPCRSAGEGRGRRTVND